MPSSITVPRDDAMITRAQYSGSEPAMLLTPYSGICRQHRGAEQGSGRGVQAAYVAWGASAPPYHAARPDSGRRLRAAAAHRPPVRLPT